MKTLLIVTAVFFGTPANGESDMKENLGASLDMILEHEGGYVSHKDDPGGRTNLGVTQAVYEDWVDKPVTEQEMRSLTVNDVVPIYENNYWKRISGDDLVSGVDFAVLDMAVNSGVSRAAKLLQAVVGVKQDGGIGPQTLSAVRRMDPIDIIENYAARREAFYKSLKTFDTFGKGWIRRNEKTKLEAIKLAEG